MTVNVKGVLGLARYSAYTVVFASSLLRADDLVQGTSLSAVFLALLILNLYLGALTKRPSGGLLFIVLQTGLIVAASYLGGNRGPFLVLYYVTAATAFFLFKPLPSVLVTIGIFTVQMITWLPWRSYSSPGALLAEAGLILTGYLFAAAMVLVARQQMYVAYRLRRSKEELEEAHAKLREYAGRAEALAVARERNRLAREIHDILAHSLTTIILQLEGALRLLETDPAQAEAQIRQAQRLAREGLREVRSSVKALRAHDLEDKCLVDALNQLAREFARATGMQVRVTVSGEERRLDEAVETALYRVVQEALTNAHRHGKAGAVEVRLDYHADSCSLLVSDDGSGAASYREGFGIMGMRERLEAVGGSLSVKTAPGAGFEVQAYIPLRGGGQS